jgi:hypothetical protein
MKWPNPIKVRIARRTADAVGALCSLRAGPTRQHEHFLALIASEITKRDPKPSHP